MVERACQDSSNGGGYHPLLKTTSLKFNMVFPLYEILLLLLPVESAAGNNSSSTQSELGP